MRKWIIIFILKNESFCLFCSSLCIKSKWLIFIWIMFFYDSLFFKNDLSPHLFIFFFFISVHNEPLSLQVSFNVIYHKNSFLFSILTKVEQKLFSDKFYSNIQIIRTIHFENFLTIFLFFLFCFFKIKIQKTQNSRFENDASIQFLFKI